MKDISNNELLKELQRRLKRDDDLNEEIARLKSDFFEINQKLEESERFKSHFISNVTNELVNPVASLLAISKILFKTEFSDAEKVKRFAELIYNEAFDIDFQLKNIFFAAKFESGKFTVEHSAFSIRELINSVLIDNDNLIKAKNLEVKIEVNKSANEDKITSDSEKLKIVLVNLLNNSIRYSRNGEKIIISVTIEDNDLEISFRDFGIGIPTEYFGKVFERFYRIDNSINSENKGSGLGLSVCKQIVELLGGEIRFEPHDNGTEVVFNININTGTSQDTNVSMGGNEFFFDDDMEVL